MSIYVRDAGGNRQKIAGVGLPGPAGKSAYQYAVEGGFTGTEEEFRAVVGVRSNDNLLDNWYLADPINQRGQNVYTTTGFTIDRWFGFSDGETYPMRVEVTKTGLYFPNSNNGINQQFEPALDTKITYTFSFMEDTGEVYSSKIVPEEYIALNGTFFGLFYQGMSLFFKPASGKKFIAVKLELGPVQTLAHKDASGTWVLNDPPPNKALELAKCQRYYRKGTLRYRRDPDYPSLFEPTADITPIPMRAGGVYTFTNLRNAYDDPLDATIQNIWVNPSGIAFPTIEVIGTGVPYMLSMDYEVSADP